MLSDMASKWSLNDPVSNLAEYDEDGYEVEDDNSYESENTEIANEEEYYDITIEAGKAPNVKIFHAHMVILNYRSPYLRRILSTNKKKSDGILVQIKLSNILPETFHILLR